MSWALRYLWTGAGLLCVAIGAAGAVLPLLPTVPLLLLAAFCFARGSDRFHRWLMQHPRFGPPIREWRAHGAISRGAKGGAVAAVALAFGASLLLGLPSYAVAVQAVVLSCVLLFILTRPDGPRG